MVQWHQLCLRLAESVQPRKLALYVECDCRDLDTARMMAKPLVMLPTLRDCALRLAMDYDREIQDLAKNTVLRLTGRRKSKHRKSNPLPPFRFLDLPHEIQLKILGYTALVHRRKIFCSPFETVPGEICQTQGMAVRHRRFQDNSFWLPCFCVKAHSAFNFTCDCERLSSQTPLLLTSRCLRDIASQVFYGKNRFDVMMDAWSCKRLDDISSHIFPCLLKCFPRGSVTYMTSIFLRFQEFDPGSLRQKALTWKHWVDTVNLLSREANLAALNLEIGLSEDLKSPPLPVDGYQESISPGYYTLVRSMLCLKGLKNLFVHLNWGGWHDLSPSERLRSFKQEQMLERMVMGPKYDAWKYGKTIQQRDAT
jgi:hypothetical protein